MSPSSGSEYFQKKITERKRVNVRDIIIMVITVTVFVVILFASFIYIGGGDTNTRFVNRYDDYNDGWTLELDGKGRMVDLPVKTKADENGNVVLKKKLPGKIEENSALMLRTYHQNLEVRVNGEQRFRYPTERRSINFNIISDEWVLVNLGPGDARKNLEIKYSHNRGSYFNGTIGSVYFGEDDSVIHIIRLNTGFDYAMGLSLMAAGAILMIAGWLYRNFSGYKSRACMGMIFFCFGVWISNRAKMPLIHVNADLKFLLSFIFMLLIIPFIFLYGYFKFETKWRKYSILGFRLGLVFSGTMLLLLVFAGVSIELISKVAYFAAAIAIGYLAVLLYFYSYGSESRFITRNDRIVNKIEFYAVLFLPIISVIGTFLFPELLWTESSRLFRISANLVMIAYVVTIVVNNYNASVTRERVTKRLHDSQIELMMGQIQPHFIFNTLSSIRTLVKVEPNTAYDMIYDFSNYLRANVDNITNMDGIKFSAEVEHIKSYVNIEKVRFGDRVNVEYDIKASNFLVPPLSIQPLVENAIKHGICKKPEGGTVYLRSREEDKYYLVEVVDNGVGFDAETLQNVFRLEEDDSMVGLEAVDIANAAMQDIMESSTLKDVSGNIIEIDASIKGDYSGNGSEQHESTGMRNIILRLREMVNARMEIESQVGQGCHIKVFFPKED